MNRSSVIIRTSLYARKTLNDEMPWSTIFGMSLNVPSSERVIAMWKL